MGEVETSVEQDDVERGVQDNQGNDPSAREDLDLIRFSITNGVITCW